MLIWFFSLAAMGVYNIIKNPVILEALNPFRALEFLNRHRFAAFLALGAVVLAGVVLLGMALFRPRLKHERMPDGSW